MTDNLSQPPERVHFYKDDIAGWIGCEKPITGLTVEYIRAHPTPERCYEVKEGYSALAARNCGIETQGHCPLSEALTIRSVEDVRREAFEEEADWVESSPEVNALRVATHIRKLAEKP